MKSTLRKIITITIDDSDEIEFIEVRGEKLLSMSITGARKLQKAVEEAVHLADLVARGRAETEGFNDDLPNYHCMPDNHNPDNDGTAVR